MVHLNIASVVATLCKSFCTIIMDSLLILFPVAQENSCLPVQHTAHRQIMPVGEFGSRIVIARSGND